jgi:hypothetical protein
MTFLFIGCKKAEVEPQSQPKETYQFTIMSNNNEPKFAYLANEPKIEFSDIGLKGDYTIAKGGTITIWAGYERGNENPDLSITVVVMKGKETLANVTRKGSVSISVTDK